MQIKRKCFFKNKACLRHTALKCIYQNKNTIYHFEYTLNLAAKIGVAGGINNIYFDIVIKKRCVFGKNGDASFFFKVVIIHNSFINLLIFAEYSALAEKPVYKGCFAVVNVSYYGDVT